MKMEIKYADPVPTDADRYGPKCRLKVEIEIDHAEDVDKAVAALNVLKASLPPEKEPG